MSLCEYGCYQEAHFQLKNGKMCCSEKYNSCPEMKRKISISRKGITSDAIKKASILGTTKFKENSTNRRDELEKIYYDDPKLCKFCNGIILFEKRTNDFCNSHCSISFSNKQRTHTEETKQKIADKMRVVCSNYTDEYKKFLHMRSVYSRNKHLRSIIESEELLVPWECLGRDYKRKRLRYEQKNKCCLCGYDTWNNKPIELRLDHIDGNRFNDERSNLRMICANCDSQLDTYCGRNIIRRPVSDGDLEACLIKNDFNVTKALKELKLEGLSSNRVANYLAKKEKERRAGNSTG